MMDFENPNLRNKFQEAFNADLETLTPQQMQWIVNLAKHVRGRCRSNAALINYLSRNFKHLIFSEEPAEWQGKPYMRMVIHERV